MRFVIQRVMHSKVTINGEVRGQIVNVFMVLMGVGEEDTFLIADEMIYKETNILFPICAMNFTAEEWYEIYEDAKDYALVYGIDNRWEEAEKYVQDKKNRHEAAIYEGEIVMGGGHMSAAQLESITRYRIVSKITSFVYE